ncbi:MAG TPA: hypothetical protein VHC20_08010 [Candidatus Paceibacterota bacterium]|nr:hypothetical protein [Candidatus Paceibacterota bacterium]
MDSKPNASYGALLSIMLILAIIVVGAFYVYQQRLQKVATPIVLPTSTTTEATTTMATTTMMASPSVATTSTSTAQ